MPTLYGAYRSRATRNFWLAGELGISLDYVQVLQAYRLKDADSATSVLNTRSPEFLSLSPAGAIPVLKDGDLVLSESLAINLYLARKTGGPLAPANLAEEALMTQWALYGVSAIEPHALAILYVYDQKRAETPEGRAEISLRTEALARPLKALNTHLGQSDGHLVGGRFTVADINMAEIARYAQSHPTLLRAYPHVDHWLGKCQGRAAFKAMMRDREAEPLSPE